ncbi:MAG: helix-turn-helix domain-containing protein [Patescibacteria group bacterium]
MTHTFRRTEIGIYSTVSERLKHSRLERSLSLDQCAQSTDIQQKYLHAMEESRFDELPGEMYARAWMRRYAELLGLDIEDLMISYMKERGIRDKINTAGKQKTASPNAFSIWSWFTGKRISILLVIVIIISYIGFLAYKTISPPTISVDLPALDFRTQENSIIIRGLTEPGAIVSVNRQPVILEREGAFEHEITLQDGLNTVTIEARKKHGLGVAREYNIVRSALPVLQETGP